MMKVFQVGATEYALGPEEKQIGLDAIPNGVFLLTYHPKMGFILKKQPAFELPRKIYGDTSVINRYMKAFDATPKNLGILLSGLKGAGKTILAKKLCLERKKPTILITQDFVSEPLLYSAFVQFLSNPLLNGCTVFIDEYEKIFPNFETQKFFLTLMDGVFETHLMFLFTTNEPNLNELFFNRLNRIRYHKKFSNLTDDIINAVADDLLVNKAHKESLIQLMDLVQIKTFDILTSVIREMNLFKEDALTVARYLNLKQERLTYSVNEIWNGKKYFCGFKSIFGKKNFVVDFYREVAEYKPLPKLKNQKQPYIKIEAKKCVIKPIEDGFEVVTKEGLIFQFTTYREKDYLDDLEKPLKPSQASEDVDDDFDETEDIE